MTNLTELQNLVDRFHANIDFYKDARNAYNEHSCRIEYIDPLLKLLGWDVANEKGLAPQYREVIAENYIAIGNPLIPSPDFPPLSTVHESFPSHGAPSLRVSK